MSKSDFIVDTEPSRVIKSLFVESGTKTIAHDHPKLAAVFSQGKSLTRIACVCAFSVLVRMRIDAWRPVHNAVIRERTWEERMMR